jgi:hypothetical protein
VDGKIKIESAKKEIEDGSGTVIVSNPQVKILKVVYRGKTSDKYVFVRSLERGPARGAGR